MFLIKKMYKRLFKLALKFMMDGQNANFCYKYLLILAIMSAKTQILRVSRGQGHYQLQDYHHSCFKIQYYPTEYNGPVSKSKKWPLLVL